jgi:cytochrome c oxidase assembly factor CtaG
MFEHLLLGDIAPLLLVLGCTGPVLAPVLRLRPVRALAGLAHPLVALPLWVGTLYVVHLAGPYDLALRNGAAHAVQHGLFFVTGALLWTSLIGPLPKPAWFGVPARIAYLTVAWLCSSALGAALVFARSPFYDRYSAGDQSTGGAVMMVEQSVVVLTLLCWLVLQLLERAGEEQELAEVAEAAGVALDPRRAQRAVAAGRGAALRDRLVSGR